MIRWLSLIGIGEDGVAGLGDEARRLIGEARLVVGGRRHLDLAASLIQSETLPWRSPIEATFDDIVAARGRPVVVLASGDPFFFGIGSSLVTRVPVEEVLCLPQASSLGLAAARLGWALQATAVISACGRPIEGVIRHLRHGARLLVLCSDGASGAAIARLLTARGFGGSTLHVLERLGGAQAAMRAARAQDFTDTTDPLTIIGIDCVGSAEAHTLPLAAGLPDDWFEHDGQMTKRDLRALAVSALRPMPGQRLWDIGAGAGSVAIEWLLTHETMRAIAIERSAERCARIARNAAALGAIDLAIAEGEAPAALGGLAAPDAIFVGGGVSNAELMRQCWERLPQGGRLVAHAVTLEGCDVLGRFARECGGDLVRIAIERLEPVGRFHALKPAMPVLQWATTK